MNRVVFFLAAYNFCVAMCPGQEPSATSWSTLASIERGHRIRVETATAKHTGAFTGASEDGITLDAEQGQLSVPRTEVVRVYSQSRSRRLRNTLIGTAIGTAIGVTVYGTLGTLLRNEGADDTAARLLLPPIGMGAAVGAIVPTGSMTKIYDRKEEPSRR
jgi:hypothetical protein